MNRFFSPHISFLFSLVLLINLHLHTRSVSSSGNNGGSPSLRAVTPPRGWNSYDSFCWTISEEEFLQSAATVVSRLRNYGYQYVVVDYLWYRKKVPGASVDSLGFDVIDEWGRVMPDPGRWPSAARVDGFTEVAKEVHAMQLQFGIHVMRGISRQAVDANTQILDVNTGFAYEEGGRVWRAQDIALEDRACGWMQHGFMSVNTSLGAGRAFIRSLYEQYAQWGIDLVKHDCVFGEHLDINEITLVSGILKELDRPILYSLSPGTSVTPALAQQVSGLANMYRITGDDWDTWGDVVAHFDVARDLASAGMIGATGLSGKSWPDLDMLPLGWLTDAGSNDGPHRSCRLTLDEQRTQITLWAMAKSPLMFGGDLRNLDNTTSSLITHTTFLDINAFSTNNQEFLGISELMVGTSQPETVTKQASEMSFLGLTTCDDVVTNVWSSANVLDNGKNRDRVCLNSANHSRVCFDKITNNGGQFQLLDGSGLCLDASRDRRVRSGEVKNRHRLSPCKWVANQVWELQENGNLVSSYSGLCAVAKKARENANGGGSRAWVAKGTHTEVYVAFFNLNSQKTLISAQVPDIAKVVPGMPSSPCNYREMWSIQDFGPTQTISFEVESHGAALFVLMWNETQSGSLS